MKGLGELKSFPFGKVLSAHRVTFSVIATLETRSCYQFRADHFLTFLAQHRNS